MVVPVAVVVGSNVETVVYNGEGGRRIRGAPQNVQGKEHYGEHWGMSKKQCRELLAKLRAMPSWDRSTNMYKLVDTHIKDWTRGKGVGYALLVNEAQPQLVNVMISHAWSENVEEFLETVLRTIEDEDIVFICAFSLYQCEDGAGPSIVEQIGDLPGESPFARVVKTIRTTGESSGWTWKWRRALLQGPYLCVLLAMFCFLAPIILAVSEGCVPLWRYCGIRRQGAFPNDPFNWALLEFSTDAQYFWSPQYSDDFGSMRDWSWEQFHSQHVLRCHVSREGLIFESFMVYQSGWKALAFPFTMVCLAFAAIWTVLLRMRRVYAGRLVVVPNSNEDIYSRLWCVYEIFVARNQGVPVTLACTFSRAGNCSSSEARCSSEADKERIHAEVTGEGRGAKGFEMIDSAILATTRITHWSVSWLIFRDGFVILLFASAFVKEIATHMTCTVVVDTVSAALAFNPFQVGWGGVFGMFSIIVMLYCFVKVHKGSLPGSRSWIFTVSSLIPNSIIIIILSTTKRENNPHAWAFFFGFLIGFLVLLFYFMVALLAGLVPKPLRPRRCLVPVFTVFVLCGVIAGIVGVNWPSDDDSILYYYLVIGFLALLFYFTVVLLAGLVRKPLRPRRCLPLVFVLCGFIAGIVGVTKATEVDSLVLYFDLVHHALMVGIIFWPIAIAYQFALRWGITIYT